MCRALIKNGRDELLVAKFLFKESSLFICCAFCAGKKIVYINFHRRRYLCQNLFILCSQLLNLLVTLFSNFLNFLGCSFSFHIDLNRELLLHHRNPRFELSNLSLKFLLPLTILVLVLARIMVMQMLGLFKFINLLFQSVEPRPKFIKQVSHSGHLLNYLIYMRRHCTVKSQLK